MLDYQVPDLEQAESFDERVIEIARVAKVVEGGRRFHAQAQALRRARAVQDLHHHGGFTRCGIGLDRDGLYRPGDLGRLLKGWRRHGRAELCCQHGSQYEENADQSEFGHFAFSFRG